MSTLVTIERSQDVEVQSKLRKKFEKQIAEMDTLGFSPLCEIKETCSPLIPILAPLVIALMYSRELMQFRLPLEFSTFNLIFSDRRQETLGQVSAIHSKFYSFYSDGTVLITTNIDYADKEPKPRAGFVRQNVPGELSDALKQHKVKQEQLESEGKSITSGLLGENYSANAAKEFRMIDLAGASLGSLVTILGFGYTAVSIISRFVEAAAQ